MSEPIMMPADVAAVFRAAEPDPAGPQFVISGDRFVIDRTAQPDDVRAATEPQRQRMQARLARMAKELADAVSGRFGNQGAWSALPATAAEFAQILAADPLQMPELLGDAYPLLLRLGRFLETDARLGSDRTANDHPLDPADSGLLADVVRPAAAWIRGFPTVRVWDDEAGRALTRPLLIDPVVRFAQKARKADLVSERDSAEVAAAADADTNTFLGEKTVRRAQGWMRNLLLAAACLPGLFGEALFDSAVDKAAEHVRLFERTYEVLIDAPEEIDAFADTVPADLAYALRALVAAAKHGDWSALVPGKSSDPDVPEDVEELAAEIILKGGSPPASWRPHIRSLSFAEKSIHNLEPLTRIAALLNLDLHGTPVNDIAPLAQLTKLRSLSLRDTQVTDLTPIARLTDLISLDLRGTQVRNLKPLSQLTALQVLSVWDTQVSDLTPLAHLTSLKFLNFWGTQVIDLGPLASLTALHSLYAGNTQVRDFAPLAQLTALRLLSLMNSQVSDLTTLAQLTELESLDLMNTQVSDLEPLAQLNALKKLDLMGTPVNDLAPLAHLTALQSLDLMSTKVNDLTPLAHLSALQSLDIRGTQISDLAPLADLHALQELYITNPDAQDMRPIQQLIENGLIVESQKRQEAELL